MVDAGNLYWKSARLTSQDRPQQLEKARLLAASVSRSGIDAMLLAQGDLALGVDTVRSLAQEFSLPYVATNLDCGGGFLAPERTITRDGLRVGVLGVVNDKLTWPGCTVSDPEAALRAGLAGLQGKVDVVVLLDALTEEASEGLHRAVPGVDLVVGGTSQPLQSPVPVPGGGLRLGPGGRGRSVGVLTFTLVEGATAWREDSTISRLVEQLDRFKKKVTEGKANVEAAQGEQARGVAQKRVDYYQKQVDDLKEQHALASAASGRTHTAHNTLVTLDAAVQDEPETAKMLALAKEKIAAVALAESPGGASGLAAGVAAQAPAGASVYAGSAACASCHAGPTTQWKTTAHSRAYASLQGQHRELDQECFACHVTGAVATGGPVLGPTRPSAVAGLTNVGCESCHGPGKQHAASPTTPMAMPDSATCVMCHDATQDEGRFDFGTYLPRIVHGQGIAKPGR